MVACRVFGHRYRFRNDDARLHWVCARCGHEGGVKDYPTVEQAERYARALAREDRRDLGKRAPLVGLLPLRIGRLFRRLSGR